MCVSLTLGGNLFQIWGLKVIRKDFGRDDVLQKSIPGVIGIGQEEPPPGPPWLRREVREPMNMFFRVAPIELRLVDVSPRCEGGPPLKPAEAKKNNKKTF
jgi:hypothetical protein